MATDLHHIAREQLFKPSSSVSFFSKKLIQDELDALKLRAWKGSMELSMKWTVEEAETYYLTICNKLSIKPDVNIILSLKTHSSIFKCTSYVSGEVYPLVELLLEMVNRRNDNFQEYTIVPTWTANRHLPPAYITKLYCPKCKIGSDGVVAFAKILTVDKFITDLNLANNRIGPRGACYLAQALLTNTTLQRLSLHGNLFFVEGAQAMAEMIAQNKTLEYLDLSNNRLGVEGVAVVQDQLSKRRKVIKEDKLQVKLNSNCILGEVLFSVFHGFMMLFSLLYMIHSRTTQTGVRLLGNILFGFAFYFFSTSSLLRHSLFKLGSIQRVLLHLHHSSIYAFISGLMTPLLLDHLTTQVVAAFGVAFIWIIALLGVILDIFQKRFPSFALFHWVIGLVVNSIVLYSTNYPQTVKVLNLLGLIIAGGGLICFHQKRLQYPFWFAVSAALLAIAASI